MFCVSVSDADQVVLPRLLHNCSSDGSSSEDLRTLAAWEEDREGALQGPSLPASLSSAALSCRRFVKVKCCLSTPPLEKGPEDAGGETHVSAASGGRAAGPI